MTRRRYLANAPWLAWVVFGWVAAGAAAETDSVLVLTPHVDAIRTEFGDGFARWHEATFGAPARVDWRNVGGSSDALRFVQSEFKSKPEGIGLDVLFGGGQEPFLVLQDQKLTAIHRPAAGILENIPPTLLGAEVYDPGFQWFAAAISSFGILQNTRLQREQNAPLVRRWEDLARPELLGWVGAGDPRNSGTMYVMFEAILQYYGWDRGWQLLTEIGGNVRRFDRVSSTTAKDVTLGETSCAFAIDFYGFSQVAIAGRTNLSFVLPEDFTAINVDCIAILKGAPHRRTAERFVDFVLSENGQRLWFLPKGHPAGPQRYSIERMSIRPDFYPRYRGVSNIEFSPFELKQQFSYDSKLARVRHDVVAALAGALLVDTHSELVAAWRRVIGRGLRPADRHELGRPPMSDAEALALATGPWKDPAFRNQKKIDWQNWARARYRNL